MQVQVHTQGKDASLGSGSPLALDSALVSEHSGSIEAQKYSQKTNKQTRKEGTKVESLLEVVAHSCHHSTWEAKSSSTASDISLFRLCLLLGTGFLVSVCFLISRSTIFLSYCLSLKFLLGRVYIFFLIITVVCDVGMFLPRYRGAHWELVLFHAGYVGWTQGFYLYPLSHHLTGPLI